MYCLSLAQASDGKISYDAANAMSFDEMAGAFSFYEELNKNKGGLSMAQAKRAVLR